MSTSTEYDLVYRIVKEEKVYHKYFDNEADALYFFNNDLKDMAKETTIKNIALTKFVYDNKTGDMIVDQIKRILERVTM
jgi:ribosome biogenesis protein Nip4